MAVWILYRVVDEAEFVAAISRVDGLRYRKALAYADGMGRKGLVLLFNPN